MRDAGSPLRSLLLLHLRSHWDNRALAVAKDVERSRRARTHFPRTRARFSRVLLRRRRGNDSGRCRRCIVGERRASQLAHNAAREYSRRAKLSNESSRLRVFATCAAARASESDDGAIMRRSGDRTCRATPCRCSCCGRRCGCFRSSFRRRPDRSCRTATGNTCGRTRCPCATC